MGSIENGVYTLIYAPRQLATAIDKTPGSGVSLLPETGNPGEQDWIVEKLSNGNITIRNLRSKLYLSFEGEPHPNKLIQTLPTKREWSIKLSEESSPNFHIVVPNADSGGRELAFDMSSLPDFPPLTALLPLKPGSEAWRFQIHH